MSKVLFRAKAPSGKETLRGLKDVLVSGILSQRTIRVSVTLRVPKGNNQTLFASAGYPCQLAAALALETSRCPSKRK